MMRAGFVLLVLLPAMLAACGVVQDTDDLVDASPVDARVPSVPTLDAGMAGSGGRLDGSASEDSGLDGSTSTDADAGSSDAAMPDDAVADAVTDGVVDTGHDATSCPATSSCDKNTLWSMAPGKFFCSWVSTPCTYGCRQIGEVAACAPSWDPGPCSQAGVTGCAYRYDTLCFNQAAQACACAGCGTSSCNLQPHHKGKLKLPFKVPEMSGSGGAAPDAGSPTDATPPLDAAPPPDAAPPDAAPPIDAGLYYWSVSCTP